VPRITGFILKRPRKGSRCIGCCTRTRCADFSFSAPNCPRARDEQLKERREFWNFDRARRTDPQEDVIAEARGERGISLPRISDLLRARFIAPMLRDAPLPRRVADAMRDAIEDASTNEKPIRQKRWISLPILAGWQRIFWERKSKRFRLPARLQVVSMPLLTVSIGKLATKLCVIWTIIRLTFIRGSILNEERRLNRSCFKTARLGRKSLRKLFENAL